VLVGVTAVVTPVTAQPPDDDAQLHRGTATFAVPGY
jgi:hypothetical protein